MAHKASTSKLYSFYLLKIDYSSRSFQMNEQYLDPQLYFLNKEIHVQTINYTFYQKGVLQNCGFLLIQKKL